MWWAASTASPPESSAGAAAAAVPAGRGFFLFGATPYPEPMTYAVPQQTDADLYRPLLERDAGAVELIYDRYGGLAYSLAMRILADPGRSEEVVQDVITTICRSPERCDPARGTLRTWLLALVRNRAIDVLRGRERHASGEVELPAETRDLSSDSDPWRAVSQSLEREVIREALDSIPQDQRQAIELAYFGGGTQSEIADRLRLPLGAVQSRLRLGPEELHSYLTGRGDLGSTA